MPAVRPTSRGVAAVVALGLVVAAAVITGTPELGPLAVVLGVPLATGPLLAHLRARRALGDGEFHAHLEPGAVEVGTRMQVKVSLTNRSPDSALPPLGLAPVTGRWRARGTGPELTHRPRCTAPSAGSMLALPRPGPGRTGSFLLDVPTGRRGVLELPSQRTWVFDPFGLVGAPGPTTPVVLAPVYPVPLRLDEPIVAVLGATVGMTPTGVPLPAGGVGELDGIRPYVPGDRLSLLYWPAEARYGTWFVRQFGAEGADVVAIALDDRAGVHRRVEFEEMISAALGAVDELTGALWIVRMVTLSGRSHLFEANDAGRAAARLALAQLQPSRSASGADITPMPPDAVLLTTRTGAERLMRRAGGSLPLPGAGSDGGSPFPTSRVVVV